jgi:hypothetical protein
LVVLLNANKYLLALPVVVVSVLIVDHILTQELTKVSQSFTVSVAGQIKFLNDPYFYQLMPNSRLSFVGCWLVMKKVTTKPGINLSNSSAQVFILRNRISHQDFSALARVLSQL